MNGLLKSVYEVENRLNGPGNAAGKKLFCPTPQSLLGNLFGNDKTGTNQNDDGINDFYSPARMPIGLDGEWAAVVWDRIDQTFPKVYFDPNNVDNLMWLENMAKRESDQTIKKEIDDGKTSSFIDKAALIEDVASDTTLWRSDEQVKS